jgi:hypothetical protein
MTNLQMRMGVLVAGMTAVLLGGCAADAGSGQGSEEGALEPITSTFPANAASGGDTQKACGSRPDATGSSATIGTGSWGSWASCYDWCPNNSFVYNVALRSEGPLGSNGDDTAMNGISLGCYDKNTGAYTGQITSTVGPWGSWLATSTVAPYTVGNPVIGGKMKIEAPVGGGDDTAANAVSLKSLNSSFVTPDAATAFGSWGAVSSCPANQAICGVMTRVEGNQGNGDDTSLNGVRFACCSF